MNRWRFLEWFMKNIASRHGSILPEPCKGLRQGAWKNESESLSHSVVSDSWRTHEVKPIRLLRPWDSPGKTLEWVAIPFSWGSSPPRDRTWVSCIAGRFFTIWATRETQQPYEGSTVIIITFLLLTQKSNLLLALPHSLQMAKPRVNTRLVSLTPKLSHKASHQKKTPLTHVTQYLTV